MPPLGVLTWACDGVNMKMNKLYLLFAFLFASPLLAQYGAVNGYCNIGATQIVHQGLKSSNYAQGEIPSCTITVYQTGTFILATIYSNSTGTPLSNPFTASTLGKWQFFASPAAGFDIVLSGGNPPNQYPAPVTISSVSPSIFPIFPLPISYGGTGQTNGVAALNALGSNGTGTITFTNPFQSPIGTLSSQNSGNLSQINQVSISQLGANPSSFGLPSNGVSTSTTGSITTGTNILTVTSSSFIHVNDGIFIGHAGTGCGIVRGLPCPNGIAPVITQGGTPGSTTYNYNVSCIDGLGGYSAAPTTYTTTTGNASISGINNNLLTFTGTAGCIEVAIYRNNALIGETYIPPFGGGEVIYTDSGQTVSSHRDIPITTPATAGADNLVAFVTGVSGTTVTLSTNAGATVSGAFTMLSDTPLVQDAINTLAIWGDANYRINYPVHWPLNAQGSMNNVSLACDTGDICFDITGQQNLVMNTVSLNSYMTLTAPSTVQLYCSRDNTSVTSQHLYTFNNFYTMGTPTMAGGGDGIFPNTVPFYNYGCEIGNYVNLQSNANEGIVFTGTNIRHIQSLFDKNQTTGSVSMSAINLVESNISTSNGPMIVADNLFTLHVTGGYGFGGDSSSHPYMIESNTNFSNSYVHDYRTEGVGGFLHVMSGAASELDVYENQFHDTNPTVPIIQMENNTIFRENHIQVNALDITNTQPFLACNGSCDPSFNPYISITSGESWSGLGGDNWVCVFNSTCSYSGTLASNVLSGMGTASITYGTTSVIGTGGSLSTPGCIVTSYCDSFSGVIGLITGGSGITTTGVIATITLPYSHSSSVFPCFAAWANGTSFPPSSTQPPGCVSTSPNTIVIYNSTEFNINAEANFEYMVPGR